MIRRSLNLGWCLLFAIGCRGGGENNRADAAVDGDTPAPDAAPAAADLADPVGAPCSGTLGFPNLPIVHVNGALVALAMGDLSGDGKADLLFADSSSLEMAVANGNGTYGRPVEIAVADDIRAVAIGDLDGDGAGDIVYGEGSATSLKVRLNNGDGTFAAVVSYEMNVAADEVVVADMNNDSNPDLVAFDSNNPPVVSIRLHDVTGFADAISYTVGAEQSDGFAVGDLSGDGVPDIVATSGANVAVVINNGSGVLGAPTYYATQETAAQVALGDIDADGDRDVVVLSGTVVGVRLNQGNGALGGRLDSLAGIDQLPRAIVLGDANGDGMLDAVVAGNGGRTSLTLLKGSGDQSFAAPVALRSNTSPLVMALRDVNADGKVDLIAAEQHRINTLLNTGTSEPFEGPASFAYGADSDIRGVRFQDITGDMRPDLVASDWRDPKVATRLATSSGFESTITEYKFPAPLYHLVRADLDRNGRTDLIAFATGHGTGLLNNGNGRLTPQATFAIAGTLPYSLAVADMDRDGAPDLFAASTGTLEYFHGNGDGTFGASRAVSVPGADKIRGIDAGDVDGDGNADLVVSFVTSSTLELAVFRGSANGTLQGPVVTPASHEGSIALRDLNRDGKLDLVEYTRGVVQLGDGTGAFMADIAIPASTSYEIAFADIDGDGILDIVGDATDVFYVVRGNGDGTFAPAQYYESNVALMRSIAIADVNADGRLDVAVQGGVIASVMFGRCLP